MQDFETQDTGEVPGTDSQALVEADGWMRQPDGTVVLFSKARGLAPASSSEQCPFTSY